MQKEQLLQRQRDLGSFVQDLILSVFRNIMLAKT